MLTLLHNFCNSPRRVGYQPQNPVWWWSKLHDVPSIWASACPSTFFRVSLRHKLLVWRVSWYWIENVNLMIIEALSTRFWLVTWRSIMHECDYDHRCDQLGALTSQEWLVINQDLPQKPTSSLPRRTAEVIKKSMFLTFNIYWEGGNPIKTRNV